jgi:CRISPR-associated protein Cas2
MLDRLNQYRIMWVMVYFDLPVVETKERKQATKFRQEIMKDGFTMFQYSMYMRHCFSSENADVHIRRVQEALPDKGHVVITKITDKQFGDMKIFYCKEKQAKRYNPQQLELF